MEPNEVQELYYIAHIDDIKSICINGILSHNNAERFFPIHKDIANESVQDLRKKKKIGDRLLHDHVNLYFNARNPMLYVLLINGNIPLCVISISRDVLDLQGSICSSCNAADATAQFYPLPGGLKELRSDYIYAQYWNYPNDPGLSEWHKSRICAEVLIPDRVEPRFIEKIYVSSDKKVCV
jgi:hypothetical protein